MTDPSASAPDSGAGRSALLVTHTGREDIVELARDVAGRLGSAGMAVRVLAEEARELRLVDAEVVAVDDCAADGAEIVLVLGGDGTFLRAAELARPSGAPLIGVNLGRIGFLAETEPEALADTVAHILDRRYSVEERLTLDVRVEVGGEVVAEAWALNEASVEKTSRERMLEVVIEVDGRPLTSFGCDGVLCSTPTGSTAYAFSAGGPVVWPDVDALLLVPNSAHALFSRALVTSPTSVLTVCVAAGGHDAVLFCDGRRTVPVPAGARVDVRRASQPVRVVRVHTTPFSDRLVAKFQLPVLGFREQRK
ncbi:MAG: NAD kinase [Geodermatophilaceae bacterium]|nr:NAD kinase [Geodermatophilaceae bacterium]